METAHTPSVHQGHAEPSFSTKTIWRTFWILLIITCVELTIGMFIAPRFHSIKIMFNVLYIFLTLVKAFYIVAEFMHLRHELKNLIMTIIVPSFLGYFGRCLLNFLANALYGFCRCSPPLLRF